MLSSKVNFSNLYFISTNTEETIPVNAEVISVDCNSTDDKEEYSFKEFSGSINLDKVNSDRLYWELQGRHINRFLCSCYKGEYNYKDIVYILENRLV